MATFAGTSQEFKRYVGPRLRNVVNLITRKQRDTVGACEHCGSMEHLESAHVHGRDRTQIIDTLLRTSSAGDAVLVHLEEFEEAFRFEHEPFEKAILVLCSGCHRKYDSAPVDRQAFAEPNTTVDAADASTAPRDVVSHILPITLDPPSMGGFKDRLLVRKAAEITIMYGDGRTESRPWDATRFTETSNVFGNLRSRPEFRQRRWQARGIVKVHVRVLGDA